MEHISEIFAQHGIALYLVGAAARKNRQQQQPHHNGVIEWIALAPRHQVSQLPGLDIVHIPNKGALQVHVESEDGESFGYINCISPTPTPDEALLRLLGRRRFQRDAIAAKHEPDGLIGWLDAAEAREQADTTSRLALLSPEPEDAAETDTALPRQIEVAIAKNPLMMLRCAWLLGEDDETSGPMPDEAHLQAWTKAAEENASRILYATREGWLRELTGLLCTPRADRALQWLYETRLLGMLLPEVHSMIDFDKSSQFHHKDLWAHTKQVVIQSHPTPLVRWAALLHDAGKTWTRSYGADQSVHFFQHEELGAILVEGIAARLHMPAKLREDLIFLVRHHQRPNSYESHWGDAALRRLIRDAGELLTPMLHLSRADFTSKIPQKREEAARLDKELTSRIEALLEEQARLPLLPTGIGKAIIKAFALTPGPQIGTIKKQLEAAIEAGDLAPRQPIETYITYLRKRQEWLVESG